MRHYVYLSLCMNLDMLKNDILHRIDIKKDEIDKASSSTSKQTRSLQAEVKLLKKLCANSM
eukprot:2272220-Lingulodinium_polyedra.AAC.1